MRVLAYILTNGIQLHEVVAKELDHLTDAELLVETTKVLFSGPGSTSKNPVVTPAITITDAASTHPTLIFVSQIAFVQVHHVQVGPPPEDELSAAREAWREN
jgi:hypothetical protein